MCGPIGPRAGTPQVFGTSNGRNFRRFPMRLRFPALLTAAAAAVLTPSLYTQLDAKPTGPKTDGQYIFRYDTFGDEELWTGILRMNEVIQSAVSPKTALSV